MQLMILHVLCLLIVPTEGISIPSIDDVALVSVYPFKKMTTMVNITCQECLCNSFNSNALAVNCFEFNGTCQFFSSFPRTYQIRSIPRTRLYFPQKIYPDPSRCCGANTTNILEKLSNSTVTSVNVSRPRCLIIDDNRYLVTVQGWGTILSRFYLNNLTIVDQTDFNGSTFTNLAYFNQAYYIGRNDFTILIVSSNNLTILNVLTSPNIQGPRDIIFLHNGLVLVLASADNNQLLFFNRSSNTSTDYQYAYSCPTSYLWPHGLFYVNDSFFYVTSWNADTITSYTVNANLTCTENLYLDARSVTNSSSGSGSHLTIDGCGRSWFSIYDFGLFVFGNRGGFVDNINIVSYGLFDVLLTDNYILYLSDNEGGRILRLDPRITC